jgi:lysophospholipase L1-like esterase
MKRILAIVFLLVSSLSAYTQTEVKKAINITPFVTSGTNTYTTSITGFQTLKPGDEFRIKFSNSNTGASTIQIGSLSAVAIKKNGSSALSANDIQSGNTYILSYDGAAFQLLGGAAGGVTTVSVVSANGFSGSVANATTTPAITLSLQNATTSLSGQLTSADWNTFNNKAPINSPAFTGTPTTPTPSVGDNSTKIVNSAFVNTAIANVTTPTELGTIISDNFNRASLGSNWTNVGSATFTISGNKLSMSRSGTISLSNYLVWNAYGNSNLESYTVSFNITAGTIDSNSHGAGLTLQSNGIWPSGQNSVQIGIDMTNTSNQGKISYYYNNSTTAILTSPNGFTITTGDVLNVTIKFIKDKFVTTVLNANTLRMNTQVYDVGTTFPRTLISPNSFRYGPVIIGGTHSFDDFVVIGNDTKGSKAIAAGHSIAKGLDVDNLANRYTELVNNYSSDFLLTNAGSGNVIADLNVSEILSLTPQNIILDIGINNLNKGDTPATTFSDMQTLVNALVSGGYTVGTNLFIGLIIPKGGMSTEIATVNASLISSYGSACIDWNTPNLDAAGTALRYTLDGTHPTTEGHEVMAASIINRLNFTSKQKKVGNDKKLYYNANGFARIGQGIHKSGTPRYLVDVVGTGQTQRWGANGNDEGGWAGSIGASSLILSAGSYYGGANWTYKSANSSNYVQFSGLHQFNIDIGKTVGTTGGTTTVMNLTSKGLFLGGTTAATAWLHLPAGTATVNTAPLKFTAGVLLTTPETGVLEVDASNRLLHSTSTTTASRGYFFIGKISTTATSTTVTANQSTILVTATGQTITLPTAVGITGYIYIIKLTASGTGTVATTSSQTIDGSTTYSLTAQYKYVKVQSDGANWVIIGNN